jgi:hypothetical protein
MAQPIDTGPFAYDPTISTFILFFKESHTAPDPAITTDWCCRLINPTLEELEIFNYVNNYKPTQTVYTDEHFEAYDHSDPEAVKAAGGGPSCICEAPDYVNPNWPKFYCDWEFVAAGRDILKVDLTTLGQ